MVNFSSPPRFTGSPGAFSRISSFPAVHPVTLANRAAAEERRTLSRLRTSLHLARVRGDVELAPRATSLVWGNIGPARLRAGELVQLMGSLGDRTLDSVWLLLACTVYSSCPAPVLLHMTQYTPKRIPMDRWMPISSFVLDAVAVTAPQTAYTSNRIVMVLTLYVDWCHNTAGLPLDARVLFRRETVDHFVKNSPRGLSEGTLRNYRSMILRVAEILLPEHNTFAMKPLNARTSVPPYSAAELDRLRLWARGQNTELKERKAMVMLAFGAGAGLRAIEIAELRRGDVVFDNAGAVVNVGGDSGRLIPMVAEWEPFAKHALRELDEGALVFGVSARDIHRNVLTRFTAKSTGTERPRSDRLRATWLVQHLTVGTPMKALMRAAGVSKFENLARYLQYIPELDTELYRALLRVEAKR